jgi:choline monooxygenase
MASLDVDPRIEKAKTIHTDFYLNPKRFEESKEKIFARSWQLVGDSDQVKDPGWVTPVNLLPEYLEEPLILSRDKSNAIHCLSNVCTHRGNLLVEKPCRVNDIRCKYHGRRFGLDGQYQSMPEFKEVEGFPTADDNLHALNLFQWGKRIFTSLHNELKSADYFEPMINRLRWLPLNEFHYRPELSKEYKVEANWALYVENYLEGFHIPFVHTGLNSVIDYSNYTTETYRYSSLQLGVGKADEFIFDLPDSSPDYGKKVAAYYFWVFPNMMFNFYPWGVSINIVKPKTISSCRVRFLTYVWNEDKLRHGVGADLHQVEMEDEDIVQQVQKGIRSRFYSQGRYSVKRETGTHHFHRLIGEFLK